LFNQVLLLLHLHSNSNFGSCSSNSDPHRYEFAGYCYRNMDAIAIAQPGGPEVIAAAVSLRSSAAPLRPPFSTMLNLLNAAPPLQNHRLQWTMNWWEKRVTCVQSAQDSQHLLHTHTHTHFSLICMFWIATKKQKFTDENHTVQRAACIVKPHKKKQKCRSLCAGLGAAENTITARVRAWEAWAIPP